MSLEEILARPAWLAALALAPLLAHYLAHFERRRARRLGELLGARAAILGAARERAAVRRGRILTVAAFVLAVLALAQPRLGHGPDPAGDEPSDLVLCLDVSRSMLARDVAPSRLERARAELVALAARARGERLALVLFAGEARLLVPWTRDLDSLLFLAAGAGPESVGLGGSEPAAALELALELLLAREPGPGRPLPAPAAVLLIADGEDGGDRALPLARSLAERGIPVSCLGIGTPAGGKMPLEAPEGTTAREGFFTDRDGREVIVRLERAGLERIAAAGGGRYFESRAGADALVELYEREILPRARSAAARADSGERLAARFQWPLLAAVLLWMLVLCAGQRKAR